MVSGWVLTILAVFLFLFLGSGTVNGHKYFSAAHMSGVLVEPNTVDLLDESMKEDDGSRYDETDL